MRNAYFGKQATVDQTRLPSPALWKGFPWNDIAEGKEDGCLFFDDFADFMLPATQTTEIGLGRYKVYNTGAGVIQPDAMPHSATPSQYGGIISMLCDTDGDASAIGTQACPFSLLTTADTLLCFEARVATTSILTNMGQWFLGLHTNGFNSAGSATTFGAAVPLANNDALAASTVAIGFNRLEDGLGVLNTSYADGAAAWTDVEAAANSTLAANTWIKLGMRVEMRDTTRCVRFFVDNVECANAITKAILLATTYLDARGLGPCMAFFADTAGTADYTYADWWKCGQWTRGVA